MKKAAALAILVLLAVGLSAAGADAELKDGNLMGRESFPLSRRLQGFLLAKPIFFPKKFPLIKKVPIKKFPFVKVAVPPPAITSPAVSGAPVTPGAQVGVGVYGRRMMQ